MFQAWLWWGVKPCSPAAMFQAWLWWGVEPCFPAAMFQAWQADVLVRYTTKGVVSVEKGGVIIRYKLTELIKKSFLGGAPLSCSHVSSMTMSGSRTLLSRSHVSSMTMSGSRTLLSHSPCFKHDYGRASNPAFPQPCFKHDYGGESNPAFPQHVSSMTGGCTCPIYYQGSC